MTTVISSLNTALHEIMAEDTSVFVLGEDILDPYGGAFKVTRGLSERYPTRILTTPVSEAAIVGIACGMAMRGMKPVVEIMFGDFITLAADQIINHVSKYRWVFNEQLTVPMVIRTPMGGYRGYGATHSQCLEKLFLGVPGLRTVAINPIVEPGKMLRNAILVDRDPVLFVEHKLLYPQRLQSPSGGRFEGFWVEYDDSIYPTCVLSLNAFGHPDVSIACYGYAIAMVQQAAMRAVIDHEVFAEIVVFSELSPLNVSLLAQSVKRSKKLIVVEEAPCANGWGAEVISEIVEDPLVGWGIRVKRVAAKNLPIASSRVLEEAILPTEEDIYATLLDMVHRE